MNARDILFYGNRTLLASLERVPPDKRTEPGVVGWWSARKIHGAPRYFRDGTLEFSIPF